MVYMEGSKETRTCARTHTRAHHHRRLLETSMIVFLSAGLVICGSSGGCRVEVFGQARGPKLPGSRPAPIRVWVHSQEGDIGAGSELLPYVADSRGSSGLRQ